MIGTLSQKCSQRTTGPNVENGAIPSLIQSTFSHAVVHMDCSIHFAAAAPE